MGILGHVRNGVIVLDAQVNLAEGTPVRVEPIGDETDRQRANRYRLLLQRLQEWNEQDAAEKEQPEDVLQKELASDHGIHFRDDGELERLLTEP